MNLRLLAIGLSLCFAAGCASLDATSERGVDLTGEWKLNAALSEDPERMLAERLRKERERWDRQRQRWERARPPGAPPAMDIEPDRSKLRPWQRRHQENLRQMLNVTDSLTIRQDGRRVEITSEVESRRMTAGAHTQVSMPEGGLADSVVGWDGEWFVIEREVRRGPSVTEKFRLLNADRLEYTMDWGGDTELAGIEVRRIFDRARAPAAAPDPDVGPTR